MLRTKRLPERFPSRIFGGGRLVAALTLGLSWVLTVAPGRVCLAADSWTVTSPDGKVTMTISLDDNGQLSYSAAREKVIAIEASRIGITTAGVNFDGGGLVFASKSDAAVEESYSLPVGKKTTYVNKANELTLKFTKGGAGLDVIARAYDDGVAYRLRLPGSGTGSISAENATFKVPANSIGWIQSLNQNYASEVYYSRRTYANLSSPSSEYFLPALLSTPDGLFVLISEADVDGTFPGSHLAGGANGTLRLAWQTTQSSEFSKPCIDIVPLATSYPVTLPWRLAIIASDLNTLVNSTLVDNLTPASEVTDVSWIKGGLCSWDWGSGLSGSLATGQMLTDYSASMGWPFVLIDGGTPGWMSQLVKYAQPKGVGVWTWKASDEFDSTARVQSTLQNWKNLGVVGIKIDFFENDCKMKMKLYLDIAREAAKQKLLVNFHGARSVTGWERQFPNVLTSEGIRGGEWFLWGGGNTADHDSTVPFTRNVVGPMDYTPVSIHLNKGASTNMHQLALAIIFESHVQHIAEQPTVLDGLEANAKDLLKAMPAGWDELKLIEGEVARFVTMARRKDKTWYVGAIGTAARTATIPLTFLGGASYNATIYKDGDTDTSIVKTTQAVTSSTTLSIPLRKNGGCAIKLDYVSGDIGTGGAGGTGAGGGPALDGGSVGSGGRTGAGGAGGAGAGGVRSGGGTGGPGGRTGAGGAGAGGVHAEGGSIGEGGTGASSQGGESGSGGGPTGAGGAGAGGASGSPTTATNASKGGGCGCRMAPGDARGWLLGCLGLLFFGMRRRRQG